MHILCCGKHSKQCFHMAPAQFKILPKLFMFQKLVQYFFQCIHDTRNERIECIAGYSILQRMICCIQQNLSVLYFVHTENVHILHPACCKNSIEISMLFRAWPVSQIALRKKQVEFEFISVCFFLSPLVLINVYAVTPNLRPTSEKVKSWNYMLNYAL